MGNIGAVYSSKGDLDRALRYYMDSQQGYDRLGLKNTAGYASLMNNIGIVYTSKGDLERALRYFTDSRKYGTGSDCRIRQPMPYSWITSVLSTTPTAILTVP